MMPGLNFAPNFVAFRDHAILNVPLGTPPVGDPSSSRYPSKFSPGIIRLNWLDSLK
jgi:hypothetical protein